MFKGKKILITGGTGSLGTALTKKILATDVDVIRIYSRDEWKQIQMENNIQDERLRFLIGDIRDKDRLSRALKDIDIVIHAAALKQVPVAEYNPFEAVKTNVQGAQNLLDCCVDNEVDVLLGVSTDKAVSPLNTYGATKLLMERLLVSKDYSNKNHKIKTMCVRYGNVLGSRGSVVPVFMNQILEKKKITITDPTMTRFNITMSQALDLIYRSLEKGVTGSIFVPKLKAYRLGDLKEAITSILGVDVESENINLRPGEKAHEILINHHEIRHTYEIENDYVIYDKANKFLNHNNDSSLKSVNLSNEYSSDKVELLTVDELKTILINENLVSKNH